MTGFGISFLSSLGFPTLWPRRFFLSFCPSVEECRACSRSSQIKGRWTAWGWFDIKRGAGRGGGGVAWREIGLSAVFTK